MPIYKNANELIEEEVPRAIRAKIYPYFQSGLQAYKEILNEEKELFSSAFFSNLKGWLLNFMMFRQFELDMISNTFPFIASPIKVNSFNYQGLNLLHNNIIINVGRSINKDNLPNRSTYRRNYSKKNRFPDQDLFYGISRSYNSFFELNEPYFAVITYGVKQGDLEFINLMVPNWNMTESLATIDLMKEFSLFESTNNEIVTLEKNQTSIKDEFKKKLHLVKGEKDESS